MDSTERCVLDFTLFFRKKSDREEFSIECNQDTLEYVTFSKKTTGTVVLEKVDNDIYAQFSLTIFPEIECERCLEKKSVKTEIFFERLYTNDPADEDADQKQFPIHNRIDIMHEAEEEYLSQSQFKKLCRPDCKGLCAECGENLNTHPTHVHQRT